MFAIDVKVKLPNDRNLVRFEDPSAFKYLLPLTKSRFLLIYTDNMESSPSKFTDPSASIMQINSPVALDNPILCASPLPVVSWHRVIISLLTFEVLNNPKNCRMRNW